MTNLGQERLLQEIKNDLTVLTDGILNEMRTVIEVEHHKRRVDLTDIIQKKRKQVQQSLDFFYPHELHGPGRVEEK